MFGNVHHEVRISELLATLSIVVGYCHQIERNLASTPGFRPLNPIRSGNTSDSPLHIALGLWYVDRGSAVRVTHLCAAQEAKDTAGSLA